MSTKPLPANVWRERTRAGGYLYTAFTNGGLTVRLTKTSPYTWDAHVILTGDTVCSNVRTIAEAAPLIAAYAVPPAQRRATANAMLDTLADDLQAAANAPLGRQTDTADAVRLERLVGAVRAALVDFEGGR
jgi:hypothetical protein